MRESCFCRSSSASNQQSLSLSPVCCIHSPSILWTMAGMRRSSGCFCMRVLAGESFEHRRWQLEDLGSTRIFLDAETVPIPADPKTQVSDKATHVSQPKTTTRESQCYSVETALCLQRLEPRTTVWTTTACSASGSVTSMAPWRCTSCHLCTGSQPQLDWSLLCMCIRTEVTDASIPRLRRLQAFPTCHSCILVGKKRAHAMEVAVVPMCNQCQNVRATIFSEQTQELMCTDAQAAQTLTHGLTAYGRLCTSAQLGSLRDIIRNVSPCSTPRATACCSAWLSS